MFSSLSAGRSKGRKNRSKAIVGLAESNKLVQKNEKLTIY
jgi:hypothetical protein